MLVYVLQLHLSKCLNNFLSFIVCYFYSTLFCGRRVYLGKNIRIAQRVAGKEKFYCSRTTEGKGRKINCLKSFRWYCFTQVLLVKFA